MWLMRFDMRAPAFSSATARDLYAAALDMAAWAEDKGCVQIVISEHHGSDDGYIPSPLILAAGMAARTRTIGIQVGALIVPLHDPIRLAEDMAVLDLASGGRVSYVTAVGYLEHEFAMLDRPFRERGKRMDACLEAMKAAWTGESFEYEGRKLRVRPTPMTPGGPTLMMGGNSRAAARRAARFDMGMIAQGLNPGLSDLYADACRALGREPKECINPPAGTVTSAFVAEDPDRAWAEMGPYLLHDAQAYARWLGDSTSVSKALASSVEELRAMESSYRIFTPDEAIEYIRSNMILLAQPLCGGLPPDLAWTSLELIASKVMPGLSEG